MWTWMLDSTVHETYLIQITMTVRITVLFTPWICVASHMKLVNNNINVCYTLCRIRHAHTFCLP